MAMSIIRRCEPPDILNLTIIAMRLTVNIFIGSFPDQPDPIREFTLIIP